ncbi:hypothetical protein POM88_000980 [Heracleum sosnowskyi]|uniref:Uncharacterized protein n=1 Tax=Heracleum sosnowskyi TaxID=360622 RepID=A0AAD8JB99_9APIA|nr:hypothetical protein POM88_000980 [Heracleum sosnowskyi]
MSSSSASSDLNGSPKIRGSSPPQLEKTHSFPQLAATSDHADIYLNIDSRPSKIDVDANPAAFPIINTSNKMEGTTTPVQPTVVRDGANGEIALEGQHRFWWSMDDVNNLTKQMGHLSPAGRL